MRFIDEFRDPRLALELADAIRRECSGRLKLMEVCGTHTTAIARYGIRSILPESIRLISGPGCPVCVTAQGDIDGFIELGRSQDNILATFGDMMRVPGSDSSLEAERARGADVRIVYSPLDAVEIAAANPDRRVVFFGIGFETTAPAVALSVMEAEQARLANYFVYSAHKLVPPALIALAADPEVAVDGFICPGHVSAVLGSRAYEPVARDCRIPCVVAGFEPLDILQSILMLIRQVNDGRSEVEIQYSRVVSKGGNPAALKCMNRIFQPTDAEWRGLGLIPASGLALRPEFSRFRAEVQSQKSKVEISQCDCGSILKGIKPPRECPAFGKRCTPENPLGPCMVSSEGACAAHYRYSELAVGL